MKHYVKIFTVLLLAIIFTIGCSSNNDVNTNDENNASNPTNETGNNEATDNDASEEEDYRIISTTVAVTEIMEALDINLVGVPTTYKELAERYQDLPDVGQADKPDMEIVKSLKPTDVLSVTTLQYDIEDFYTQTNTPITFLDLESVEGMLDSILYLGEKYNRIENAEAIINKFTEQMADIDAKTADKASPSVLILLGVPGSYLVATENSYLGDLARRAGAVNVFPGEDDVEYVSANTEYIQQTNPDIILRAAHGMPDEVVKMFDKEFQENDIWQHFNAVKNDRVYDLEETLFGTTANLAAYDALVHLLDILYEE